MAFASFERNSNAPMGEINMVPLIDVMLVLLVIFIVTAPLLSHSVDVDLPRATTETLTTMTEKIDFAINAEGQLSWNGEFVDRITVQQRFIEAGKEAETPSLYLHIDQRAPYQYVAEILADASNAGLTKIGFVTLPEEQTNQ